MKTFQYFKYTLLCLFIGLSIVSCSDDEKAEAPRLFRPIVTLSSSANNLNVEWNNIKGATSYEIKLYKITTNEEDILKGTLIQTVTTQSTPFTFANIAWDEKYGVRIKAMGDNIESEYFNSTVYLISKPTMLNNVDRIIDNAAIISWKEPKVPYTALVAIPTAKKDADGNIIETADLGNPITYTVTADNQQSMQKTITGLAPLTTYKIEAYSGEVQDASTYQGRVNFTTKASVNYNEKYGEGNYIDIRSLPDDEAAGVLTNTYIAGLDAAVKYIIVRGGFEYTINGVDLTRDMTFVTGMSLAGNAIFKQESAIKSSSGNPSLKFESINFISDKIVSGWEDNFQKKDYFNLQVIGIEGGTVKQVEFKNCNITGYRSVVRNKNAGDVIESVLFNGCTLNAIGDQGIVCNNKVGTFGTVTFSNSTILNTVIMVDLRGTTTQVNIEDCTMCYTPLSNTNTAKIEFPLFYINKNGEVTFSISRTIMGPAMEYNSRIFANKAATTGGSIMYNVNATDIKLTVQESYRSNFTYAPVADKTYEMKDLTNLNKSETETFTKPEEGDFKLKEQIAAGALKWRLE